jgi:hypothetical protein
MNWTEEELRKKLSQGTGLEVLKTGGPAQELIDLKPPDPADVFIKQLKKAGLPEPGKEHRFHRERRWRFDLFWEELKLACEIDGGIWMQTKNGFSKGHAHPKRFLQDIEKLNEAAILGWRVIRVTPKMIDDGRALDYARRLLKFPPG